MKQLGENRCKWRTTPVFLQEARHMVPLLEESSGDRLTTDEMAWSSLHEKISRAARWW
jgi:hypothetical protein